MVDDHRIAGEAQILGHHHHAVGGGPDGVPRHRVQQSGVGLAGPGAAHHLGLAVVQQDGIILQRAEEGPVPQLFPGCVLIEGPDDIAEFLVGALGGGGIGLGVGLPEVFGGDHQGGGQGLPVDRHRQGVAAGRGVVGRRNVAPPARRAADALDVPQIGLHQGRFGAHHPADFQGGHPALFDPLGRQFQLGRSLDGEPEGILITAHGPGRALQTGVPQNGPVGGPGELNGGHLRRQPPHRQLGLVFPVGRVEEIGVFLQRTLEIIGVPHPVGGDGQLGISSPVGQGDGGMGLIEDPQFLDRQGGGRIKGLVQHPADQGDLPAAAVDFQHLPAELNRRVGQAAAGGKGIAGRHHRPQQDGDTQHHACQPEQDLFDNLHLDPSHRNRKRAHRRSPLKGSLGAPCVFC